MELFFNITIIIICGAILLDLLIGDPRWLPHPVVGMGKLISFMDRKLNQGSRKKKKLNGTLLATLVIVFVFFITTSIVYLFYKIHVVAGVLIEVYLLSSTIAIKGLKDSAMAVAIPLNSGDFSAARRELSMIVGRDTAHLDEDEIVRGTVETIAENTTDGITAPIFWAFLGGAPLAMTYRAINTLDSMVGYKNNTYEHFGWASAKLDDVVNWIPARMTALSIWVAAFFIKGSYRKRAWHVTFRDATKHPSPNSGWTEAMTAALMGVQLGGRNTYKGQVSERARMGEPLNKLRCSHIKQSIVYMHGGWIVFVLLFSFIWILLSH